MNKSLCLFLVTIAVVLTGCQYINPADTHKEHTTIKLPNSSEKVEYVIYCDTTSELVANSAISNNQENNVRFESISERDFSYASRTTNTNENVEQSINFTLGKSKLEANYVRSFSNSLSVSANEKLRTFGHYDEYRNEEIGDRFSVRFQQHNNELVYYSAVDGRDIAGTLTEQEAKNLADAFLTEKYGVQFAADYPNCEVVTTNDHLNKIITVGYTKYICGYPSTDRVLVTYNMAGEIKAFNATTKGLFDATASDITLDKISNAENVLLNTIPSTWYIGSRTLALDADGSYYLRVTVSRHTEGGLNGFETAVFYINIE